MQFPVMARGLQTQIGDFGVRAPESPSLPFSGSVSLKGKGATAVRETRIV